ncbi:hypothetical protein NECAME_02255 [Necator americanus]|uniref:Uncharacterized protein n=1 Tax=Necator americanus TaxID=51031 RepID=W2TI64_NECAM|nr:hypothetical protein NECAME_02255 [Necator americanus]ETN80856.1 hypothetical protein NECAME_02255 [Necator americanus]
MTVVIIYRTCTGSMTIKCKVCLKDNPQILEINRNLKPQLLELFTSFTDGFSRVVRDIGHISDFQNGHRQRLMRHFHIKSRNFEKLQTFCQEEIKKKNQYKHLNDMTHDPFRTPVSTKASDQRSFMTSTPFKYPRKYAADITESTMSATRPTDTTVSFTALGEPTVSIDPGEETVPRRVHGVLHHAVQPHNERIEAIVTTGNSDESHHEDDHLAGTNADPSCFEGEEPTEEEVALAMRLQNPCDMLKEDDPSAGRSYEESAQKTSFDRGSVSLGWMLNHFAEENTLTYLGAHTQGEETTPCSACGSSEEPHFVHYKKCETAIGSAGGAFIWRYRCGKEECAQFFGDFYAYDKVSNSFVRVSEDGGVPEDAEDENGDVEEQPIPQATEAPPTIVDQSPEESPLEERQGSNCGRVHLDSVETTADSSGDPRSRRRQRATARKKTATPSITKVSPNSKKLEKRSNNRTIKIVHKTPPKRNSKSPPKAPVRTAKPVKSAKVLKTPAPKRRREKTLEPAISDAAIVPKKLRKGYVLEPISPSLQHLNSLENPPNMNGTQQPTYSESSTQTLGGTHYFSVLIEELINGEADFYSGLRQ